MKLALAVAGLVSAAAMMFRRDGKMRVAIPEGVRWWWQWDLRVQSWWGGGYGLHGDRDKSRTPIAAAVWAVVSDDGRRKKGLFRQVAGAKEEVDGGWSSGKLQRWSKVAATEWVGAKEREEGD